MNQDDYDYGKQTQVAVPSAKRRDKKWVYSLVATISLARISHGIFLSITGPTLLFLAENTNSEVSQVSAMFSGRSVGIFLGAVIYSVISNRFPTFKPLTSLGFGLALNGLVLIVTPFSTSLATLIVVTTIGGLMFGYLDTGMEAIYLKLWGEEGSRPYIQSFHFAFSVGALLAPVIAQPFLTKASQSEEESGTTCPGDNLIPVTTQSPLGNESTTANSAETFDFNPINWCFIICGVYTVVISILMILLSLMKVEDKVVTCNEKTTEKRPEEPLKDLWLFFIPLCLYYFCCVASEQLYHGYIYAVSFCSSLDFDASQASLVTSVFWLGFGIGRGSGIFISIYVKPTAMIITDLIATTCIMTIMSIWGESSPSLVWAVSFLHGLAVATLFSSGVSWCSQVTNMSGTYMFVYSIGGTLGSFVMLPAGGAVLEKDPFSVMYLITLSCVVNIVAFAMMYFVARRRQTTDLYEGREGKDNPTFGTIEEDIKIWHTKL